MSKIGVDVSYRYSAKVDANQKDSPWAGAEVKYSIEQDAPGEFDADKIAEDLFSKAKVQVFAQLGVEMTTDENGALQPVVPVSNIPVTAPKKQYPPKGATPRADYSGLPRVTIQGKEYIDFRQAKIPVEAGGLGLVKPRFPDFKTVDLREGFYLTLPDGITESEFGALARREGIL